MPSLQQALDKLVTDGYTLKYALKHKLEWFKCISNILKFLYMYNVSVGANPHLKTGNFTKKTFFNFVLSKIKPKKMTQNKDIRFVLLSWFPLSTLKHSMPRGLLSFLQPVSFFPNYSPLCESSGWWKNEFNSCAIAGAPAAACTQGILLSLHFQTTAHKPSVSLNGES